ncbi:Gfo/Idh/MocA family protein [Pelagicoccus mobilis]|uniref:Gfo/Idh/MocA family oxidoreductase n=1 Tax=Pelagicoccus mobilis TaxID=415221 RepID=A0A934RSV9_9BACT|nr:Gfo/Idh/MocA family oxidoreductase [Pelagicoccus mobilis]MBK1875818.1 Gfo/Idh/MocA family oxidoreductase [Pelagicoccus mobilis]
MNRRNFVKTTALAGATLSLPLFSIGKPATAASKSLKVGCIGMGRMMYWLSEGFMTRATVVAVCDVDTTRREVAQKRVHDHYGNKDCAAYVDYRELLARDDIDVVCIATPDHWHATITIDAARAGKDIYCEKPLTHDIDESIRVMKEVKKAGVVLQTGSQQRGMKEFRVAVELIRNKVAGNVLDIKSNFWGPGRPYDLGEEELEPGLDWNRWCGPAPLVPYNSKLSPRGVHKHFPAWRQFSDYGGGGVCDMGAHHLDIIQWALDKDDSGPIKALPPVEGGTDWGAKLIYEGGLEVTREDGFHVDFICEHGRIQASRGQFHLQLEGKTIHKFVDREDGSLNRAIALTERDFLEDAKVRLPQQKKGGHQQNFLDAVISRGQPLAHIDAGSRSAICCHLMNLAYREQKAINWKPEKLKFGRGAKKNWLKGSRRDYS